MQQKHELRKPLSFFSEILTLFPLTTQPASSLKKQTILRKKKTLSFFCQPKCIPRHTFSSIVMDKKEKKNSLKRRFFLQATLKRTPFSSLLPFSMIVF